MPPLSPVSPRSILDDLQQSLDHVLTTLSQKWTNTPLSLTPIDALTMTSKQRSFQLKGPDDVALQVHFAAVPLGDNTFEIQVEVEDGPIRCFTYDVPAGNGSGASQRARLGRKVSSFLLHEIEPRLGQQSPPSHTTDARTDAPQIELDRDATIQHMNNAARTALQYASSEEIDPNFFSHVDGHNLRRVMRDLAQMVSHDLQRARWLVRLQTGTDRWHWYRAAVRNELRSEGTIRVHLRSLGTP